MPNRQSYNKTRQRAKELRKQMTPAEAILWGWLRSRQLGGFKFRRQHPIEPYIADFYCADRRLVVEVDGGVHAQQTEHDQQRSQRLTDYGYRVLRVSNREVENDLDDVLRRILEACHALTDTPLPGSGETKHVSQGCGLCSPG